MDEGSGHDEGKTYLCDLGAWSLAFEIWVVNLGFFEASIGQV
jgi:hypothetical protein